MPKQNQKLEIRISPEELSDLATGSEFRWTIATDKGEDINVLVKLESQEDFEEPIDEADVDEEEEESEDDDSDDSF